VKQSPDAGLQLCPCCQGMRSGFRVAITSGVAINRADVRDVNVGQRKTLYCLRAVLHGGGVDGMWIPEIRSSPSVGLPMALTKVFSL